MEVDTEVRDSAVEIETKKMIKQEFKGEEREATRDQSKQQT